MTTDSIPTAHQAIDTAIGALGFHDPQLRSVLTEFAEAIEAGALQRLKTSPDVAILPQRNASEHDFTCRCREWQRAGYAETTTLEESGRLYRLAHAVSDLVAVPWREKWIAWKRVRAAEAVVWHGPQA